MENIKNSKVREKIIPLNKAIGIKDGQAEFFMSEYSPNGNSLDRGNMIDLTGRKEFKQIVEVITLENVFNLFNGEPCLLMKMDCEGCEYSVLGNLRRDILGKIGEIHLEYHNGLQSLPNILAEAGYDLKIKKGNRKMGYILAKKRS